MHKLYNYSWIFSRWCFLFEECKSKRSDIGNLSDSVVFCWFFFAKGLLLHWFALRMYVDYFRSLRMHLECGHYERILNVVSANASRICLIIRQRIPDVRSLRVHLRKIMNAFRILETSYYDECYRNEIFIGMGGTEILPFTHWRRTQQMRHIMCIYTYVFTCKHSNNDWPTDKFTTQGSGHLSSAQKYWMITAFHELFLFVHL